MQQQHGNSLGIFFSDSSLEPVDCHVVDTICFACDASLFHWG
jgi:hypothetical protein